jgi:hypothetical protein
MGVGNMSRTVDHECPRYGKRPSAVGISFLDIEAGTFQHAFRGVIHFKSEAELLGNLPAVIDQNVGPAAPALSTESAKNGRGPFRGYDVACM